MPAPLDVAGGMSSPPEMTGGVTSSAAGEAATGLLDAFFGRGLEMRRTVGAGEGLSGVLAADFRSLM